MASRSVTSAKRLPAPTSALGRTTSLTTRPSLRQPALSWACLELLLHCAASWAILVRSAPRSAHRRPEPSPALSILTLPRSLLTHAHARPWYKLPPACAHRSSLLFRPARHVT